jgi:signal transduction histidine kinase/CheY-like chemotaxis protein
MRVSLEKNLFILFSLVLAALVATELISFRAVLNLTDSQRRVIHTQQTRDTLSEELSAMQDAETGQRGFLLTGRAEYLTPYEKAIERHRMAIAQLGQLTAEDNRQAQLFQRLNSLTQSKWDELRVAIRIGRSRGLEAARQAMLSNRGKYLMDEIRSTIAEMQAAEEARLQVRSQQLEESERQAHLLLFGLCFFAPFIFVLFFWQVRRVIAQRNRLLEGERQARSALEDSLEAEREARDAESKARKDEVRARAEAEHLKDEAEEASRLKDEFLATVSHELRTPLNAVLGWTQLLCDGRLDEAHRAQAYEVIQRSARSQAQLIEDLLDVSRILSGKLRLEVRPTDLNDVIQAALHSVQPAADNRGVRLQKVLDPRAGLVAGDFDRLQQVVWNLLSNAIKFTPHGGRVLVRLSRVNSHTEIVVEDTGQGIAPEFLGFVFDRFRQADGGSARRHGGLGLGLAIVRHLVELHGGTVRADSAGEGQGASFTVAIPLIGVHALPATAPSAPKEAVSSLHLEENTAAPPSRFASPPNNQSLQGLRILVVDDHADTLEVMHLALESYGAAVETAGNAADALRVLAAWRPDVLLSDIGMPQEDGYSLIQKVRALAPGDGGSTPAVAITAFAKTQDRVRALAAGFQMHLAKPVEPDELIAVVTSLVSRRAPEKSVPPDAPVGERDA